jgi:hypothetical protein
LRRVVVGFRVRLLVGHPGCSAGIRSMANRQW